MKHIIGHKNPDTDTVCSAIAYEHFLNAQNVDAKAFALGPINNETAFVLDYFDVTAPEQITKLPQGTEIILLDHNEETQSIDNINDLDIVEIIDHHKVKLETDKPISIFVKPLGSSCSIIAEKYFDTNTELPREIAGILLAGVVSDTLFFRSPTTTDIDRELAEKLSGIAGVADMEKMSLRMFDAKSDLGDISIEDLIRLDYKEFDFKDGKYGIGVMETTNINFGLEKKDAIVTKLQAMKEKDHLQGVFFVIIDILQERSYTLCADDVDIKLFAQLFDTSEQDGVLFVDKLVSRKKQIIPLFEKM